MPNNIRRNIWLIWVVVAAGITLFMLQQLWRAGQQYSTIPYSQFEQLVAQKQIADVQISSDTIQGTLNKPLPNGATHFVTKRVDPAIADKLAASGAKVSGTPSSSGLATFLSWIVPIGFFYLLWMFMMRGTGRQGFGGLAAIGKSRAKVYVENDTKVTFKDVAGVDEAKYELQEIVSFLKDPKSFGRLGARAPKGVLLVGPPGTGKTLLARAVAGEANVPFFSISGSEFVEMFVGVGAARVRDLFEQARKTAPAIIFIDELDALGRSRSTGGSIGGYDEKEQTLNQLLSELDGFDPTSGVILLGATNRPEVLDPALLRAGRFDRQVVVDRPTRKGRLAILKIHLAKINLDPTTDLDRIASLTMGFTGADLANLVNEAAVLATRRGAAAVTFNDLTSAIERIVAGIEKKSRVLSDAERRRVAYHEMGHALVAASLPDVDPVHKVSIIPRGVGALGYTIQRPTEDRFVLSMSELRHRITVLMGGRAAESLIFAGDVSTGAADDLERATEIALEMVTRYGMADMIGARVYKTATPMFLGSHSVDKPVASETTLREIDVAVHDITSVALDEAHAILMHRRAELDKGAELLLKHESITSADFPALVTPVQPAPPPLAPVAASGAHATPKAPLIRINTER